MNWIILIVAGLFETGFAFCLGKMKEATGAEYCWWGAGFLLSLALSMTLLAKATQSLPIGTAYPVWTGIGAVGTVLAGILFLNEPATFPRIFFLLLLIGAVGTDLCTRCHPDVFWSHRATGGQRGSLAGFIAMV